MFAEKYKGVALTSIDPFTIDNVDECDWLRHELTLEVAELEGLVNKAKNNAAKGIYSDPDWFQSTNQLLREAKAVLQTVQSRRGALSRQSRASLESAFVDVAKEALSRETFHRIMDQAEARVK